MLYFGYLINHFFVPSASVLKNSGGCLFYFSFIDSILCLCKVKFYLIGVC